MAIDKLVDSGALDTNLTSVATAIRTKGRTSAQLSFPDGFVTAIEAISTGKPEQEKTANPTLAQQVVLPDDGYSLSKVTIGAMPTGAIGAVTASKTVSGNVATITPQVAAGTAGYNEMNAVVGSLVTVQANELVNGNKELIDTQLTDVTNYATAQIVDANLIKENIKAGVTVLGIIGEHAGGEGKYSHVMVNNYGKSPLDNTVSLFFFINSVLTGFGLPEFTSDPPDAGSWSDFLAVAQNYNIQGTNN